MKNRLEELLKNLTGKKPVSILFAVGIIGIALIAISSMFPQKSGQETTPAENPVSTDEYLKTLQSDINNIVVTLSGDNNPCIAVTLDTSVHYVYADSIKTDTKDNEDTASDTKRQQKSDTTENNCVIIEDANGKQSALKVTEKMPNVRGVSIVCSGADNEQLSYKIKNAVTTLLNISENKVFVTGK